MKRKRVLISFFICALLTGCSGGRKSDSKLVENDRLAREEAVRKRKAEEAAQENFIPMVYVAGGTFTMGCTSEQDSDCHDNEKPAHSVTLSSYYIGKYEVTQAQWKAVMGSNPSYFEGDNLPVEEVSWNSVQEFICKLNQQTGKNYRLPTEVEWEFAARGGNKSRGYKYSGSNTAGNVAWYDDNSGYKTHPVGTKSPNELGIYDMSGNVWEWCSDWYGKYSSGSQTNPRGASSGSYRVDRGGSWYDFAGYVRVSNRGSLTPVIRNHYLGFRLASDSK
jgi:formylglycine-generating enzyme required for sulfatase activity